MKVQVVDVDGLALVAGGSEEDPSCSWVMPDSGSRLREAWIASK